MSGHRRRFLGFPLRPQVLCFKENLCTYEVRGNAGTFGRSRKFAWQSVQRQVAGWRSRRLPLHLTSPVPDSGHESSASGLSPLK